MFLFKESNYWTDDDADAKMKIQQMEQISKICHIFSIEKLRELNDVIQANCTDNARVRSHIEQCVCNI